MSNVGLPDRDAQAAARNEQKMLSQIKRKEECVRVVVRCRPLNSKERQTNQRSIVTMDEKRHQVRVEKPADKQKQGGPAEKTFTFDQVYGPDSRQKMIFDETARPIIDSVINGYNGTIFAYGQTGTGKTFTMEGDPDNEEMRGIMPNAFYHVFNEVDQAAKNIEFLVRASFLEIYLDEVYDLLNKQARQKMLVREHKTKGIFVQGLSSIVVRNAHDLFKLLRKGQKSRSVGATAMNPGSSRSHSILNITIETSVTDEQGQNHYKVGKLHMVDLAGSERQEKTESSGERLDEAKAINSSLAALGNVIKALVNRNAKHIPFRDSKLTRLLQDSLGGNTKTVMIANIGPAHWNYDETISTLRYANRAKDIKNKPTVNEDATDAMLRQYQEEIAELRARLAAAGPGAPMVDEHGLPIGTSQKEYETRIIEKIEYEDTGISAEDIQKIEQMTKAEKEELIAMTEAERMEVLKSKNLAEEAAQRYSDELAQRQQEVEREMNEYKSLEEKLQSKAAQLLQGGQAIEAAVKQTRELKQTEAELQAHLEAERRLKQELEEAEEKQLFLNEQYKSRSEEIATKTEILKKLWNKLQQKKGDLEEFEEEFEVEREELVEDIRQLDKQLKLKQLVLESFIPSDRIQQIEKTAHWDPFNDTWAIPNIQDTGNHVERPRSRASSSFLNSPARRGQNVNQMAQMAHMMAMRGSEFDPVAQQRMMESMPQKTSKYLSYPVDAKKRKKKGTRKPQYR